MKKALLIAAILTLSIFGYLIYVVGNLDQIVKKEIQEAGSELTGVAVSVAGVQIDLTDGTGIITGLGIANPEGYQAVQAFQMDLLKVDFDIKAATKGNIRISELDIQSPVVNLELRGDGSSNLQTLADNVAAKVKQYAGPESSGEGKPVQMTIDLLSITGVTYTVIAPRVDPVGDTLPDVQLSNISGTPAQIGEVIVTALSERILKQAGSNYLRSKLDDQVEDAKKKLLDRLRN